MLRTLVYGNFWIALGAALLTLQSRFVLEGRYTFDSLPVLLFLGTWSLYSAHRLVALRRLDGLLDTSSRLQLLHTQKNSLLRYTVVGGALFLVGVPYLSAYHRNMLIVPGFLALFYTFPIPGTTKRLRDFSGIKNVVVALAWAWLTAWLPLAISSEQFGYTNWLIVIERFLFVLALCIPFDIRDLEPDAYTNTHTLALSLGAVGVRKLAIGALVLAGAAACINGLLGGYKPSTLLAIGVSLCSTYQLIRQTNGHSDDWHYVFWLDGMLVLQPLLTLLSVGFLQ